MQIISGLPTYRKEWSSKYMSGFAGFYDTNKKYYGKGEEIVRSMTERIRHRGPDGDGYYSDEAFSVGHCRSNLSGAMKAGQPLLSRDGRYLLVFDGKIYNCAQLRRELIENYGVRFLSDTDSEVLLNMCAVYGKEALRHLRGMYSFVFYDRRDKTLFCAKDPFGVKSLYYTMTDDCFLFASEIKAFFPHPGYRREFEYSLLPLYLQFRYIPTEETAFTGVKRLMPGHCLFYDGKNADITRFFELPSYSGTKFRSYRFFGSDVSEAKKVKHAAFAADTIGKVVEEVIKDHTADGASIGIFRPDGAADELLCEISGTQKRYGGSLSGNTEALSENGSCHTIGADDFFSALPQVQYHCDEPYAEISAVSDYLLSRYASSEVNAVLSDEGADELFGEYNVQDKNILSEIYRYLPFGAKAPASFSELYDDSDMLSPALASSILRDEYKKTIMPDTVTEKYAEECSGAGYLRRKMHIDLSLRLPLGRLEKTEKLAMASALELRFPYLDLKILGVSQTLSDGLLIHGKNGKYALRAASESYITADKAYSDRKNTPASDYACFGKWISGEKYRAVLRRALESETCAKFFDCERLLYLLDEHADGKADHSRLLYTVYTFILWYEVFFLNPEPREFLISDGMAINDDFLFNPRPGVESSHQSKYVTAVDPVVTPNSGLSTYGLPDDSVHKDEK